MRIGLLLAVLAACGGTPKKLEHTPVPAAPEPEPSALSPQPSAEHPQVIHLEPMRIEVVTDDAGQETVVAYDAGELFDAGNEALMAGKYDDALARYDQLLADFPDSELAVPALFNAGLAHEEQGQWDAAVARYADLSKRKGEARDVIDGMIRLAAVLAELQRWPEAARALDALLDRNDLTPSDRIEGLARLGYVLIETKDYTGAEEILRSGLGYWEEIEDTEVLRSDYFVAMSYYYLAQIPHRQFAAIPIRLPDKQIRRDIEAKSERILIAYDRYLKTIEVGNPYWASAAGYQIASMYKQLWDSFMLAPIPPAPADFDAEAVERFEQEYTRQVHERSRQFLEKALDAHQNNAALDGRGIRTAWTDASKREGDKIADILARESAGELVSPAEAATGGPTTLDMDPDAAYQLPPGYVPGRVDL